MKKGVEWYCVPTSWALFRGLMGVFVVAGVKG